MLRNFLGGWLGSFLRRVLNEVLSLNAQECTLLGIETDTEASSMKS